MGLREAKAMREISVSVLAKRHEVELVLLAEKIRSAADNGLFHIEVEEIHPEVQVLLQDAGYGIPYTKNGTRMISWAHRHD